MCLGNTLGFTTYMADPATVLTRLPEIKPTVFMSVPSHWEKLAIMSGGDIDKLREVTGGKNVPPQNIELRFRDDAVIAHVVVYGEGKKYLVAGVWLHDGIAPSEEVRAQVEQKIETVNKELASYETIKKFTILDRPLTVEGGLLTASFKVRRKMVYEVFAAALESLYIGARPS
jgi:long-subunit acyl-CoA synthetase (AMP-forming)